MNHDSFSNYKMTVKKIQKCLDLIGDPTTEGPRIAVEKGDTGALDPLSDA